MTAQLTLGVRLRDEATFENFYPGNNQQLINCLQTIITGQNEQFLYLWGKADVGRSHLLQAACHTAAKKGQTAYLPLNELVHISPDVLEDLESLSLVCIDDIDAIAGRPAWEEALFHLYNRIRASGTRLIVAGSTTPQALGIKLADLVSRLTWGITFQLHELAEADKLAALQMRALARGMKLSTEVGEFLLRRCSRTMSALFEVLEKLDQESLAAQRKLTIPFIKEVLMM